MDAYDVTQERCPKCGSEHLTFVPADGVWERAVLEQADCEDCQYAWHQPNGSGDKGKPVLTDLQKKVLALGGKELKELADLLIREGRLSVMYRRYWDSDTALGIAHMKTERPAYTQLFCHERGLEVEIDGNGAQNSVYIEVADR